MKVQTIVAAAGLGERLGKPVAKPLVPLGGKPLVAWCLEVFEACSLIESVILVVHPQRQKDFLAALESFSFKKIKHVIAGGQRRCDSVQNALGYLDSDTELTVIHDGARPFVTQRILTDAITEAQKHKAAIAAVPVKPTIKSVDLETKMIIKTLERQSLFEVQTPQVFQADVLREAYHNLQSAPTDDASLVEKLGIKVKVSDGSYQNIKVTTPEDLLLAEQILKERQG